MSKTDEVCELFKTLDRAETGIDKLVIEGKIIGIAQQLEQERDQLKKAIAKMIAIMDDELARRKVTP